MMNCNNYFDMTDQGDSFEIWQGLRGPAGTTFTPAVSSAGVISWTNNGGLPNPSPVDIRGPQGPQGEPQTPSDATPLMDGAASAGISTDYARGDHRHPSDYNKAPVITDTASGSIASFDDGADGLPLESLVVHVEAVQDLHGYDAPWPAGGGKNLLPYPFEGSTSTKNGVTFTVNTDGTIKVDGTATADTLFVLNADLRNVIPSGTSVAINGCPSGGSGSSYRIYCSNIGYDYGSGVSGSIPSTTCTIGIAVFNGYSANNLVFKPMIRLASVMDDTFASYSNICPFNGWTACQISQSDEDTSDPDTIVVSWQTEAGTVYYGSANIKTGVMAVEGGVNVYDGVNSVGVAAPEGGVVNLGKVTDIGRAGPDYYSFYTTNIRIGNFGSSTARILTPQEMSDGGFLCSNMPLCTMFETGDPTTTAQYAVGARLTAAGNVRIYIYARADTGITTVDAMNAKLAEWYESNTPFTYCFRLKTPFTVQLSPGQLFSTLYGVNNIWADCGPVTAGYPADTKLYIDSKIAAAVAALS